MYTTEQMTPMPRIGDKSPGFKAITTHGDINFPAGFQGKWVILFSHPADFTSGRRFNCSGRWFLRNG
jgi:peroxiredoxin (alkyl hydroperoxide reductase subunit C)